MIIWHMLSKDADRSWAGLALLALPVASIAERPCVTKPISRIGSGI